MGQVLYHYYAVSVLIRTTFKNFFHNVEKNRRSWLIFLSILELIRFVKLRFAGIQKLIMISKIR